MKTIRTIFFFLFILLCRVEGIHAQNRIVDSLLTLIKTDNANSSDTSKVRNLNALGQELWKKGDYDKSMKYANDAVFLANTILLKEGKSNNFRLKVAIAKSYRIIGYSYLGQGNYPAALKNHFASLRIREEIGDKLEIADSYYRIGTIYGEQNKYSDALQNLLASLKIYEELKDKKNICHLYSSIGVVYESQGNYPDALKQYLAALKIREEIGDKKGIASSYNDIGLVYWRQGKYADALEKYFACIKIMEELGDKTAVASTYNNIGLVYVSQGNYSEALKNQLAGLKTRQAIGNKENIADSYNNIGMIYDYQGKHSDALKNYLASLKIRQEIGDKQGIAGSYINLGGTNAMLKNFSEARRQLELGLSLSKEIGYKQWIMNAYQGLYVLDSIMGNYKASFANYKLYVLSRDSMFNEESAKKSMQAEMNYQFEKKQNEEKLQQEKKDTIAHEEKQKQTNILILVSCILMLLGVFSVFIYNRFRVTHKQKEIIEKQKTEVDEAYLHLGKKNRIIEEKNKDITDSINYAKRIQDALLKEEEHVTAHFPPHFILFKPKDIVSGDFYWGMEKHGHWYLCIADCTGHGVPGAFMSMLGIAFLNEINAEEKLLTPAEILDKLSDKIVKELKQTQEKTENKDGMDISMMRLNLQTKELEWAGANNPLWIVRNQKNGEQASQLIEYAADKQPIGYTYNPKPFTNNVIPIQSGDTVYLFSDGYADQFGGPKEKKFKYKQLQEVLLGLSNQPVANQKEILNKTFEQWRGNIDQVDDVAMIGIRM